MTNASDIAESTYCPECGYDLRGLGGDRCPECGLDVRAIAAGGSGLPWPRRREIGRLRAFTKQAWMALWGVAPLTRERLRAIDLRDAQRFRLICAAYVAVPWLAVWLVGQIDDDRWASGRIALEEVGGSRPFQWVAFDVAMPWSAGVDTWWVLPLGIAFWALCVTGVHTYFFHPRAIPVQQQNRAIALAYYLSGAPAWQWMGMGLLTLAAVIDNNRSLRYESPWVEAKLILLLLGWGSLLLCWAMFYLNIVRLRASLPHGGRIAALPCAIGVPVLWALSLFVALGAWPWLVGFVLTWVDSFRG